jgi:arylsulfatase A-like enzyme
MRIITLLLLVGCFGGKHVNTPVLDKLAREGAKLTSFYVPAAVCTPSRAGLMTGSYPLRVSMHTGSKFGVLLAGDAKGLNPDEITIPEVLKKAGYATGMFGKWHLGDQPEFLPTRQGFDEFFGIPYSHDIHPFHPRQSHFKFPPLPLLDQEEVIEMDPDADQLTKRFTERAVAFIEKNHEKPFFLYVPHPIPHKPLHVSDAFKEQIPDGLKSQLANEPEGKIDYKLRDKIFRQAIAEIDWSVGQIIAALEKHNLQNDARQDQTRTGNQRADDVDGPAADLCAPGWRRGADRPQDRRQGHFRCADDRREITARGVLLSSRRRAERGAFRTVEVTFQVRQIAESAVQSRRGHRREEKRHGAAP